MPTKKRDRTRQKLNYIQKGLQEFEHYLIKHPGCSLEDLKQAGFVTEGLAGKGKLTTMLANGKALEIKGRYYPHTREYLRLKYPRAAPTPQLTAPIETTQETPDMDEPKPTLADQVDAFGKAVSKLIEPLAARLPDPDPFAPTPTVTPRTVAEKKCLDAIAHFEKLGKPFRYCDIQKHAGIADNYLSANPQMREVANAAIERCGGVPIKSMPKTARGNQPKKPRQTKASVAKDMPKDMGVLRFPPELNSNPKSMVICQPIPSAPMQEPERPNRIQADLIKKWRQRLKDVEIELNEAELKRKVLIAEFEMCAEILKDLGVNE